MSSVAVIGAGAWGTALAIQAARAGNSVTLWARDPQRAGLIAATRENARLPGVRLPEPILVTQTLPVSADLALLAVPMQHLRTVLQLLSPALAPLIVCAKSRSGSRDAHPAASSPLRQRRYRGRSAAVRW
jgi:glycerol-3-phosphate dehydrogenase (NAD(P)+)